MQDKTRIKICGITNENDALKLSKYDIFALGFIITQKEIPSRIDLNLAVTIIKKLPSHILSVVGVANLSPEEIISICQKTEANAVQIQKGGTMSDILKIKGKMPELKIWKVVSIDAEPNFDEIADFERISDVILIHSKENEWQKGLRIVRVLTKPFIVAGGLDLHNVKRAIEEFRPFAIDLIRGVETVSGKKDFDKVEELINIVRNLD
jgi:phosphoribosylanthranilate isomerase